MSNTDIDNATTILQASRTLYLTPDGNQAVGLNSYIDPAQNYINGLILLQDINNPPNQIRTTLNNTGIEQNDALGNITIDVSWDNLKNLKLATPALRLPATSNLYVVNDTYEANDNNLAKTRTATLSAVSASDPKLALGILTSGETATLTQNTLTYLSATGGTPVSASLANIINGVSSTIAITDTNTSATYYPTFVDSAGSGKTLRADIGTTPFSINPNTSDLRFGTSLKLDASNSAVSVGFTAGTTSQGTNTVAIGANAGQTTQGASSVAIGQNAGTTTQAINSVAIGLNAGNNTQSTQSVAIGCNAGQTTQGTNAVAIGLNAGLTTQSSGSVAVGNGAGNNNQGTFCVAIGRISGQTNQGANAIAVGNGAGQTTQGANTVAIGNNAGNASQGTNAIAIGNGAGQTSQTAGSICLNASGSALNPSTAGCYINPIRAGVAGSSFTPALPPTALYYNTTTFEILRAT